MRVSTISLLSAVLAVASAQRIKQSEIPSSCNSVCADTVSAANTCKNSSNGDSFAELQCICGSSNANTYVPNCELCVRSNLSNTYTPDTNSNYDYNDFLDKVNPVYEVMTSCGLSRAQATASPTVVVSSVGSSRTIVSTSATATPSGSAASSMGSSMGSSAGSSGTTPRASGSVTPTGSASIAVQSTAGAAPQQTGAVLGLGALGLVALGML
ncbi:hypothetical protein DE146DRAFT_418296 [Phaeosphaeria sp. MPI-PUGE-AT-0046c]|nr:hypothetical protein DE146DRAFT_418296 [Phaeosphaeria sp. MPI-PUGE-AT-0046c]